MNTTTDQSFAEPRKGPLSLESRKTPTNTELSPTPELVDTSVNPLWMITGGAAAFLLLLFAVW